MPQDPCRDPRLVVVVADEGSNPFELACACEVFGARRRPEIGRELYRFRVVTPRRRVAVRDAMFTIGDAGDLGDIDDAHTVFVPNRPDTDTPTHPAVITAGCVNAVRLHGGGGCLDHLAGRRSSR